MTQLYVFVDSERPDQYLNVIAHCVLTVGVEAITFLHIKGLSDRVPHPSPPSGSRSRRVLGNVETQLASLADQAIYKFHNGTHFEKDANLVEEEGVESADRVKNFYTGCRERAEHLSNEDIEYSALADRVKSIANASPNALLDVTAIKKTYIGDLIALCLRHGIRDLHTFDLYGRPDFNNRPWTMLLDALQGGVPPRYAYVNILDTEIFKREAESIARPFQPSIEHALRILRNAAVAADRFDQKLGTESDVDRFCRMLLYPSFPDISSNSTVNQADSFRKPDSEIGSIKTFIEYKFVDEAAKCRGVIDQMHADIRTYAKSRYRHLVFVVAQTGSFFIEDAIRSDLLEEPTSFLSIEIVLLRIPSMPS